MRARHAVPPPSMLPLRRPVQVRRRPANARWARNVILVVLALSVAGARRLEAQGAAGTAGSQGPTGAAAQGTGSSATIAAMTGDLRRLVSANEVYHAKSGRYNDNVGSLATYHPTAGVTVTILVATATGWSAQATAAAFPGKSCVISIGSVSAPPTTASDKRSAPEAVVVCDHF
jgi:hypothetical protein